LAAEKLAIAGVLSVGFACGKAHNHPGLSAIWRKPDETFQEKQADNENP
jgi:hypothetical protein